MRDDHSVSHSSVFFLSSSPQLKLGPSPRKVREERRLRELDKVYGHLYRVLRRSRSYSSVHVTLNDIIYSIQKRKTNVTSFPLVVCVVVVVAFFQGEILAGLCRYPDSSSRLSVSSHLFEARTQNILPPIRSSSPISDPYKDFPPRCSATVFRIHQKAFFDDPLLYSRHLLTFRPLQIPLDCQPLLLYARNN